jgi:AbrB family looped-hinge helix DNA binding protein
MEEITIFSAMVNENNAITIPKAIRDMYNLKRGDILSFHSITVKRQEETQS